MHLFETKFMHQKLRGHRVYLGIPCSCRSMVLIGLPKVKFLVWASGGFDKNREGGKQMIEAREEGGYMAPSSAPQIKAPRSMATRSAPRSAAPSLLPRQTPHQTPSLCGRGTSAPYSVAPRRVSSAPTYGVHFHKTLQKESICKILS